MVVIRRQKMVETHQLSDHFAQANYKLRPKTDNMYF